ncbi:MAG: 50S ribosomal protein L4 [Candidatus Omnitrophica bacterium]|nr:50S ribosomal protein L4 [Candidatus Omnitrophota bacterium]
MDNFILPVYNQRGEEIDKVSLNQEVFDGEINSSVIYQVVCMYLANKRKGLASTKTRKDVSGGGRKPWRQKGTGRARHGSIRSPLWRGGGVVFGPHPKLYSYRLPRKIKLGALKSSLNAKLKEKNIIILDKLELKDFKTKNFIDILVSLNLYKKKERPKRILLLVDRMDEKLKLAISNLSFIDINLAKDTNALEVLNAKKLIIFKDALHQLTERLKQLK